MKKILLLAAILTSAADAVFGQVVHKVKVSNYQFSPKTVNAVVGDKIKWVWVNGKHTTTSTSIPSNANPWDKAINKNHHRFVYTVKKAGKYQYQCNFHFQLGMVGTIKVSRTLAAGLHDFYVIASNESPLLTWKTKSSQDVAYFSLEKSTDGDNFQEMARVYPDPSNQYKFTDTSNIASKFVYYQVEIVTTRNERQLSEVKMYMQKTVASKLIVSIGPNPVSSNSDHLMLQFNALREGIMQVQLYNEAGVLVKQTQMSAVVGLNNGHVHLGSLTPGTYYLVCSLNGVKEKHTILVK